MFLGMKDFDFANLSLKNFRLHPQLLRHCFRVSLNPLTDAVGC